MASKEKEFIQTNVCFKNMAENDSVSTVYLDDHFFIVNKPANICIDGTEKVTLQKLAIATLNSKNIEFGTFI